MMALIMKIEKMGKGTPLRCLHEGMGLGIVTGEYYYEEGTTASCTCAGGLITGSVLGLG